MYGNNTRKESVNSKLNPKRNTVREIGVDLQKRQGRCMQLIVQAICTPGKSLRDAIAKDGRLEVDSLGVSEQKRSGRPHGWTKIHSTLPNRHGAINVEWDADTNILVCRVVTRGRGK